MLNSDKLRSLSWFIIGAFIIGSISIIVGILILGGMNLLQYVWTTLIQALGLGIATTAALFFLIRLVWRLHALPMGIAMLFFILGVSMFVSVSVGRMYALQYPVFVQSFGPERSPGLPLTNVVAFFKNMGDFERIEDISRDPNEVPLPIAISKQETAIDSNPIEQLEAMTESGILELVDDTATPDTDGHVREIYLETTEVLAEIAPGITYNYWTFNNAVPGPLFRV